MPTRVPVLLWGAVALLALATLATARPAAADDASPNIRRAPGDSAAFTLAGTNGYELYFKSEKGMLSITVSRQRPLQPLIASSGKLLPRRVGASSESTYVRLGVSRNPEAIEADLGPAGRVSLVFQPSGEKRVTITDLRSKTERCVGATKVVRRLGSFVGHVSFHGENGYTSVEATSVPGTVGTSPFRNCSTRSSRRSDAPMRPPQATVFTVSGAPSFFAHKEAGVTRFFAAEGEQVTADLHVVRTATAVGRADRFAVGSSGLEARLRPPAPFSGSGVYADPAGGPPRWSGDLGVSFPGVVKPLAGAGMERPKLTFYGGGGR